MQLTHRFGHTATEQLFHYWDRRRGARPAPDRSEIEPGDIRDILPDTFILEVEDDHRFSWRLAGTRVCALHCRELKGRDFLSDWAGKERATLLSILEAVLHEAAVGIVQFEGRSERDQILDMEMVLLPLRVFGRPTCRILGSIGLMDTPYWLGTCPPERRRISHMRLIWPSGMPAQPSAAAPPALKTETESLSVLASPTDNLRRYRHLTVLDGGKS